MITASSLFSHINPFAQSIQKKDENKKKDDIVTEKSHSSWLAKSLRDFCNIPRKIIYWNPNYNSGNVLPETVEKLKEYLDENGLHHVLVSVEQYKPQREFSRVFSNPNTSWLSKLTIGIAHIFEETVFPHKYIEGDSYSPQSDTIYLYSNDLALALRLGGIAKDYHSKKNPSLYKCLDYSSILNLFGVGALNALTLNADLSNAILIGQSLFFSGVSTYKEGVGDLSAIFSLKGEAREQAVKTLLPLLGNSFANALVTNILALAAFKLMNEETDTFEKFTASMSDNLGYYPINLGLPVAIILGSHLFARAFVHFQTRPVKTVGP